MKCYIFICFTALCDTEAIVLNVTMYIRYLIYFMFSSAMNIFQQLFVFIATIKQRVCFIVLVEIRVIKLIGQSFVVRLG